MNLKFLISVSVIPAKVHFGRLRGGVRYVAQRVDVTGKSGVFWRKFGITAGLGILYHAGFYSKIGIEQDFYATAKVGFEEKKAFVLLTIDENSETFSYRHVYF